MRPELGHVATLCTTAHPLHTEIAERFGASMPEATVRQCGRQCVRDSVPPCLKQRRDRTLGAPSVNPVHGRRRARMRTLPSPRPPRGLSLGAPLADLEALVAAVVAAGGGGALPALFELPRAACQAIAAAAGAGALWVVSLKYHFRSASSIDYGRKQGQKDYDERLYYCEDKKQKIRSTGIMG